MPRTVETIVAAHQAAQARKDMGLHPWSREFDVADVFGNDDLPIEKKIQIIAERMRSVLLPRFSDDEDLEQILDEMEWIVQEKEAKHEIGAWPERVRDEATDWFDSVWDAFYDWCDLVGRVWVKTF